MPAWLAASAAYLTYVALVAALLPGVSRGGRLRAVAFVAIGAFAIASAAGSASALLRVWVLPPIILLAAYWATGALFVAPMVKVERALHAIDDRLRIRHLATRTPPWLATLLELGYAGVYPLIPIALGLHMWYADPPDAARFWGVILITDFICFGTLPWLQTRPPRSIEGDEPWRSALRRLNVRLMRTASIRVNTFPSGHAAEALACALLALDAPPLWLAWMFFNVVAISAGAVLGRYHYAVDALAGWIVAVVVWWCVP